jgi:hypothetical protein
MLIANGRIDFAANFQGRSRQEVGSSIYEIAESGQGGQERDPAEPAKLCSPMQEGLDEANVSKNRESQPDEQNGAVISVRQGDELTHDSRHESCALPISFRIGRLRIPTGFRPKAQGWEARPTLGTTFKKHFQRRRCCANHRRFGRNPVGVVSKRGLEPKVGQPLSRKANLGLEGVIPLG